MLPNLLPVAACRQCPQQGQPAKTKMLVNQEAGWGVMKYGVSYDWRFQPFQYVAKQEGLQLAEASFRDKSQKRR